MNPALPQPLSHAYLITGGNEEGRRAYARRLAQAYLCRGEHPPCGQCLPCRKVAGGIHPDVTWVTLLEDKQEISVDQARSLRADAYILPNEGERKVYIIDPADTLSKPAQNALLKVLEDGPDYGAFLLLAGEPGLLLDTVRSRCEQISLPPEQAQADPALREKGVQIARLLLGEDELAAAEGFAELEQEKWKSGQLLDLLAFAEEEAARALRDAPRRAAHVLQALRACRERGEFYPGVGHTLGWLAATLFG